MAILTLMFGRDVLGTFEMDRDSFTIGRSTDCDIIVDNLNVSRHHTRIDKRDGLFYIEDLKSNNGTYLNGNRIDGPQPLTFGDEIAIGKHTLRFDSHSRLERPESLHSMPHAPEGGVAADEGGTVFVNPEQMERIQQKMSAARRAHLRVAGVPGAKATVEFEDAEVRIGKDERCDVRVRGLLVPATQCIIGRTNDGYYLEHVGGFRPTRVNGAKTKGRSLQDGDVIEVAGARLTFYDARDF